ncbi:MAG TPA: peptide chain release factor-like protein [Candidatus Limnocylindrales bacterium]|nr:peptide chain release factor-like protein [Candidatus Limnocylindrales bacterium]
MRALTGDKAREIGERLAALGIREEDLEESFVRSGGKGGQNVNKVSTCVVLRHKPTRIQVKCQEERSQALNRYKARVLLADKVEDRMEAQRAAAIDAAEKKRRQKRRPSRQAKQKTVAEKRARSQIKHGRGRIRHHDD